MSNHLLFVYGSLRSGFHQPAYEYISKYFSLIGEAKVKGQLYDMGEYPAALPSTLESYIVGELYRLNNDNEYSWAFSQLDDYEGVNPDEGEPVLYRRQQANVYVNDEVVTAWIYWFNGDTTGRPLITSGDVADYLKNKNRS